MGRLWWYDSYWEKDRKPKRRFCLPGRQSWVWIALLLVSLVLAMNSGGFRPMWTVWLLGFIHCLCRILAFAILVRAILSWFIFSRYNRLVTLLDDITELVLAPLKRVVPSLGMFDITPLIAMVILYFIPSLFDRLVSFLGL
jgi:YggT family protein